jgi:hypothetical protein
LDGLVFETRSGGDRLQLRKTFVKRCRADVAAA